MRLSIFFTIMVIVMIITLHVISAENVLDTVDTGVDVDAGVNETVYLANVVNKLVGEGQSCTVSGKNGVCTSSTCSGGSKVAGRCPGPSQVQCCVKGLPAKSPAASSTGRKSLSGSFPYKFPYSSGRHIVADIQRQRIRVYDGSKPIKEWKISSGKNGWGFKPDSWQSPIGRLRVIGKYGNGAPLGMQFEYLRAIGKIGYPTDSKAHVQTRILQLTGLDVENANTASRAIYIHGTNAEMQLGWRGSHGCFRMGNKEVVELFNLVQNGVDFYVAPQNAWPSGT